MVSRWFHVETNLVAQEAFATEIFDGPHVVVIGSSPPTSKCVVNRQEIRIFCNAIKRFDTVVLCIIPTNFEMTLCQVCFGLCTERDQEGRFGRKCGRNCQGRI
jgi:hypothetical protein